MQVVMGDSRLLLEKDFEKMQIQKILGKKFQF
jgi:hypothetical protein